MSYRLRGHHLLCLLGFRGMGYSPEFTSNMAVVYEQLRTQPDSLVTIVSGIDDLCKCYPSDKPNHCETDSVHQRDHAIIERLGLVSGSELPWNEVLTRIRSTMVASDIPRLCASCPWQPYGVCEAGLARIAAGEGLAPLPEQADR